MVELVLSSLIYGKTRGNLDFDNPVTVESIDLSKWLTENFNKDDHIILKMDIEDQTMQEHLHTVKKKTISMFQKIFTLSVQ